MFMFIQNRSTFYHDNTVEYDEHDWTNEINRLRDRVELLEKVVSNFPGGLSLFDENLQMVLCNYRQFEMLEYTDELLQNGLPTMEELFRFNAERGEYGPGDVEMHVRRRLALAKKQLQHCYERERPNGDVLEIRGAPLEGGGFVTTYTDVTERRRAQDLIEHLTRHDALTSLSKGEAVALGEAVPMPVRFKVDLPDPDRPIRTRISPCATVRLQLWTPSTWPVSAWISPRDRPASISGSAVCGVLPKTMETFRNSTAVVFCALIPSSPAASGRA